MNTLFLRVSFNSVETISLPANIIELEETNVVVNTLLQDHPKTLFFTIKHQHLNTLLDFTNCAPYELWYFDEEEQFTGKSFSLQKGHAPFLIQTQARFIALVPYGINHAGHFNQNIFAKKRGFTLSEAFLPETEPYAADIARWTLSLFNLTDEELIETLNKETQKKGWVQSRAYYNDCLKKEIRNRSFDSDILFDFDADQRIVGFKIGKKVAIIKNTLNFIE
jgi:hypothetical protein